jgi:hypothetical protein
MQLLVKLAQWEAILLVVAIGAVTLWKVLTTADLSDLLRAADGSFSPGRVQMLMLTIPTAMRYLIATLHDPSRLPDLPQNLLAALGGSHFVYPGASAGATGRRQGQIV